MAGNPPRDAPTLTAWIDTDGDDDDLHILVEGEETVLEDIDANVAILAQNDQYTRQFERSALTLLTAYQRALASEDRADEQIPDSETVSPEA